MCVCVCVCVSVFVIYTLIPIPTYIDMFAPTHKCIIESYEVPGT